MTGGEEKKILNAVHSSGGWTVATNGIYFVRTPDEKGQSDLCFYELQSESTRCITTITKGIGYTISASPDGKSILYTQVDAAGSDLMLVENFR